MFDLSAFELQDTGVLNVKNPVTGQPTGWEITIAGPTHPKTVALNAKINARIRAQVTSQQRGVEIADDVIREQNVRDVCDRILDWTHITLNGEDFPFSEGNAYDLLINSKNSKLFNQITEFMFGETSFLKKG